MRTTALTAVLAPGFALLALDPEPTALAPERLDNATVSAEYSDTLDRAIAASNNNSLTDSLQNVSWAHGADNVPPPPSPPPPPPSPPPLTPEPPLGSCAIVSSSEALLSHALGSEIDAFDQVMRFNLPPVNGFEVHVGRKNTLAMTNMVTWTDVVHPEVRQKRDGFLDDLRLRIANDPTTQVQVWIADPLCASPQMMLCDPTSIRQRDLCQDSLQRAVDACNDYAADPRLYGHFNCRRLPQGEIDRAWRAANLGAPALRSNDDAPGVACHQRAPTSGLMGVLSAINRCDTVRLFGFLMPTNGSKYYNPNVDNMAGLGWPYHNVEFEQGIYIALQQEHADKFSVSHYLSA